MYNKLEAQCITNYQHHGVVYLAILAAVKRVNTLFENIHQRCHIGQLSRNDKPPTRQLQTIINLNYRPLFRLGMDLKLMPRSNKGPKYILCIIDEVTNYLITVPIHQSRSEEIGNTLIDNVC